MAERIPLIYNPSSIQIQEVSLSDEVNVGIVTAVAVSNLKEVTTAVSLANSHFNYMMVGPVQVGGAGTITVGAGVSYVVV
tara:strand:+ start:91 stop:330 length:240 start_codon:yes stop_codon:yes gene_type:complete